MGNQHREGRECGTLTNIHTHIFPSCQLSHLLLSRWVSVRSVSPHQLPVKLLGEEPAPKTFLNFISHHSFLIYYYRPHTWFPSPIVLYPLRQCSLTHHKYRFLFEPWGQKRFSTFLSDISLLTKPNKPLSYLPNSHLNTWKRLCKLTLEVFLPQFVNLKSKLGTEGIFT